MKSHITVKGTKYRVVKAYLTFEQAENEGVDKSVCNGCVFEEMGDCRTRFRAKQTLKCVDGDADSNSDAKRADYILIPNTREALAEYVAKRLV